VVAFRCYLKRCAAFLASLWVKFPPRLQLSEHLQWCSVSHPTLHKYFSHPSFFFPTTPPIKLKLGLQRGRTQETTIATHLDQIKLSSHQQVLSFAVHVTGLCIMRNNNTTQRRAKTISLSQNGMFWPSFIQSHRLEGSFLIVFVNWLFFIPPRLPLGFVF
jgi:hypothetical protein